MSTRKPPAPKAAPRKRSGRPPAAEVPPSAAGTRERILDAAYGVLSEQGYDKLTQLAVCKAAAISQGHLTYYFPTRAALLLGLAGHCVYRQVEQMMRQVIDGAATPPQPAELAAGMAARLRDRNNPRIMVGLLIAADGDARIKPALHEFIANARRLIARLLVQCGVPVTEENITLLHANLIGLAMLNFAHDDSGFAKSLEQTTATLLKNWRTIGSTSASTSGATTPTGDHHAA